MNEIEIKSLKEYISDIINTDRELNETIGTAMHGDSSIKKFIDSYMDAGCDKKYAIYNTPIYIIIKEDKELLFVDSNGVITTDLTLNEYVVENKSELEGYIVDNPVNAVAHAMANTKLGKMNGSSDKDLIYSKNAVIIADSDTLSTIFIFAYFPAFNNFIGMYRKG